MPYEDDERREARERLQARMDARQQRTGQQPRQQRAEQPARQARSSASQSSRSGEGRGRGASQTRSSSQGRSTSRSRTASTSRASSQARGTSRSRSSKASNSNPLAGVSDVVSSLVGRFEEIQLPFGIPSITVPVAIVVLVLVILFAFVVPTCTGRTGDAASSDASQQSGNSAQSTISATTSAAISETKSEIETVNTSTSINLDDPKQEALASLLGEEPAEKLLAQAKSSPESLWIAAHPSAYAFDGLETQYKVMKLAADEPAATSFVRYFPSQYPAAEATNDSSLAVETTASPKANTSLSVPHLYEWDRRWGYTLFGKQALGLAGDAPTALAMVYQALKDTTDLSPYDMAVKAKDGGFLDEDGNLSDAFYTDVADSLGLSCEAKYPLADTVEESIANGHVGIAVMAAGSFGTSPHAIVLVGLADDGQVVVNDPYSAVNSSRTWDANTIAAEATALYSYSV